MYDDGGYLYVYFLFYAYGKGHMIIFGGIILYNMAGCDKKWFNVI